MAPRRITVRLLTARSAMKEVTLQALGVAERREEGRAAGRVRAKRMDDLAWEATTRARVGGMRGVA